MKDTTSRIYLASGCTGKAAFSTPQLANKVQRRRSKKRGTYMAKQHVYHCKACGNFHIGTAAKSRHATTSSVRQTSRHQIEGEDNMI